MSEHSLIPLGTDTDMRRISNSEVSTWLTCQRKYYYEFILNLEPKQANGALGKGTLFHSALASYYDILKAGEPHHKAVAEARKMLLIETAMSNYSLDTVMEVDRLLKGYWAYYMGDPDWEILEVEANYDLPITDNFEYSLRLDLYVRSRSTGAYILVDHKTTYDFWSQDDLDLNPQFPKYIASMRANGKQVDYAILNQVRSRALKNPSPEQLFKRAVCKPSLAKVQTALREQVLVSQEITRYRELPLAVQAANSTRILNKAVCKWCNVKSLCLSEYDGGDITYQIEYDFKQRTYGYNAPSEDLDALL